MAQKIKNPGPEGLALSCPQWRLLRSLLDGGASWSNGVMEQCKISNSKHQITGF
jgi:hypothetical protein